MRERQQPAAALLLGKSLPVRAAGTGKGERA